ncbi:MAG: hypothetical protein C4290_14305 [Chloroflexota bacterium]
MTHATRSVLRWALVVIAAALGSWLGRALAAAGEPLAPLLRLDGRTLIEQDVAPGLLAAELFGRGLGLGLAGQALVAALGAAASALVTGPRIDAEPAPVRD